MTKSTGKKAKAAAAGSLEKKTRSRAVTASLEDLKQATAAGRAQYGRPARTRKTYDGYIQRGKKFLEDVIAQHRAKDGTNQIETNELAKAFNDDKPNKYSAIALELFLTPKCLTEDNGISTAEGIRGAFSDYWENM